MGLCSAVAADLAAARSVYQYSRDQRASRCAATASMVGMSDASAVRSYSASKARRAAGPARRRSAMDCPEAGVSYTLGLGKI